MTLSPTGHRGGSYLATDGAIDPPRNVRAYSLAMQAAGVELRERTAFTGLRTEPVAGGGSRVVAVETDAGPIETERVLLTGGPSLRAVGRLAGIRIPVGAARHTVAVLEPHPAFDVAAMPMVFDIGAGLYWRLEEGGLLFGWSDPDEAPGEARSIDWAAYEAARARLAALVPATRGLGLRKIWAATIDYTPDHLPILGPGLDRDGRPIAGVTVASAGGHGMMWGPGVARVAADLVTGTPSSVIDVDRARARSVRRAGTEPAGDRPDRAAVPGQRLGRRRLTVCARFAQIVVLRSSASRGSSDLTGPSASMGGSDDGRRVLLRGRRADPVRRARLDRSADVQGLPARSARPRASGWRTTFASAPACGIRSTGPDRTSSGPGRSTGRGCSPASTR